MCEALALPRQSLTIRRCLLRNVILMFVSALLSSCEGRSLLPGTAKQKPLEVPRQRSKHAYVTLLYGDEFVLGARVLGQSIRESGSEKDMVVLASSGVTEEAANLLQADGWIVERIELLANPNKKRPTRFWGVYTKLRIFNMTNYEKIVFLDADTIVIRSIDDLFECKKFCANVKHSERLNSGVLLVEPSRELFDDMMTKTSVLESYTGGDQGFLNSYYPDFANAPIFKPGQTKNLADSSHFVTGERLPVMYNADVGLFMLANKWMVNESTIRVMHFTLGPLKPWDWWSYYLITPVNYWQAYRMRLPDSLPGAAAGRQPGGQTYLHILAFLPLLVVAFLCRGSLKQVLKDSISSDPNLARGFWDQFRPKPSVAYPPSLSTVGPIGQNPQAHMGRWPSYLGAISILACFLIALLSFGIAIALVPRQVWPWTGVLLVLEWTLFLFLVSFLKFLQCIRIWGSFWTANKHGSPLGKVASPSAKWHGRGGVALWDFPTATYLFWIGVLVIVLPAVPFALGISALFARLGCFVAGGMVLVSFLTIAAERLSLRWFNLGKEGCSVNRTGNLCTI